MNEWLLLLLHSLLLLFLLLLSFSSSSSSFFFFFFLLLLCSSSSSSFFFFFFFSRSIYIEEGFQFVCYVYIKHIKIQISGAPPLDHVLGCVRYTQEDRTDYI